MTTTRSRSGRWGRLAGAFSAMAVLTAGLVVAAPAPDAEAHGGLTFPATRTYACYVDGVNNGQGGGLNPQNEMCQRLFRENGNYPFYNWFGNLLSNSDGRHREVIPNGELCGPGPDFSAVNHPGNWPTTDVQPGQRVTFQYNAWAPHPGTWDQYITKDGWDPSQPLGWDDLEPAPFDSVTDPPIRQGGPEGAEYYWNATLPNKSGYHIIYSIWTRSDSPEAFYNCSDVNFGGGGNPVPDPDPQPDPDPDPQPDPDPEPDPDDTQAPTRPGTPTASNVTDSSAILMWEASTDNVGVTGYTVRDAAGETVATSTTPSVTVDGLSADTSYSFTVVARDAAGNVSPASSAVTFRTAAADGGDPDPDPVPGDGACTAELSVANSWPGGYQANVTVTAGSSALSGWTTAFALPSGGSVGNLWSGTLSGTGSNVTVSNEAWNGSLGAGQSTSYGFIGSGDAPSGADVSCSAG